MQLSDSHSRLARLFPIAFFFAYLNLTVLLFAFGPWRFPVTDGLGLYAFLLLAHIALAVGYLTVRWRPPLMSVGPRSVGRLATISVAATLLLLVPTSLANTGHVLPDVATGILDPGGAYARSVEFRSERTLLTAVAYVRILVGPLLFLLLPLLVVFWQSLDVRLRVAGVVSLCFIAATYIAMGANKGLGDTLALVPWLVAAGYLSGRLKLSRRDLAMVAVGWIVVSAFWLALFAQTQAARAGSSAAYESIPAGVHFPAKPSPAGGLETPPAASTQPPTAAQAATPTPTFTGGAAAITVDPSNGLVRFLPQGRMRTGVIGLSGYITHGYFGLYLSLSKPFVPMFGVGNSIFLTQQAVRITGDASIAELSYPKRIEVDGWDSLGLWSSLYPWVASDVSFPGTLVVMLIIGRLFGLAWFDSLSGRNPLAYAVLAQFVILLFYAPANNQTVQSGEGFTAFWTLLVLWLVSRSRPIPFLSSHFQRQQAGRLI